MNHFAFNTQSGLVRRLRFVLLALPLLWLSGCAVVTPYDEARDPLLGFNRAMYQFNDAVDRAVLEPVAQGYVATVPGLVRTGISNFFNNLGEPLVMVNNLLQGKVVDAGEDLFRFLVNSTFGLLGLIDVAGQLGVTAHDEDFGQTLGVWGVGEGWYLVLPLLGPSTARDALGLVPNYAMDPVVWMQDEEALVAGPVRLIDTRASLLGASEVRDAGASDPYFFTRESYRQLRWSRIHDGQPPAPEFDFDDLDDYEP